MRANTKETARPKWQVLTWEAKSGRWLKKHQGKQHWFQAGGVRSKATHDAALTAWLKKKESLDQPASIGGVTAAMLAADPGTAFGLGLEAVRAGGRATDFDTIGTAVESWLDRQRAELGDGMSQGCLTSYTTKINYFKKWAGADEPVTILTEEKFAAFYQHLKAQMKAKAISRYYARDLLAVCKSLHRHLWQRRKIDLLRNLNDHTIETRPIAVKNFPQDEITKLLASKGAARTKLYLLLMMNCGMYQGDIADLKPEEIDWEQGKIVRKRSKTKDEENVPMVTYQLWPETLEMVKRYSRPEGYPVMIDGEQERRAFVNTEGLPLVRHGAKSRIDNIKTAYANRLAKPLGIKTQLKLLRKTSASLIEGNKEFGKKLAVLFLGQSPSDVSERHYFKDKPNALNEALAWLRTQYTIPAKM